MMVGVIDDARSFGGIAALLNGSGACTMWQRGTFARCALGCQRLRAADAAAVILTTNKLDWPPPPQPYILHRTEIRRSTVRRVFAAVRRPSTDPHATTR